MIPTPSSLGLHLILGPEWPAISTNLLRNYREGRIGVVHGVAERA